MTAPVNESDQLLEMDITALPIAVHQKSWNFPAQAGAATDYSQKETTTPAESEPTALTPATPYLCRPTIRVLFRVAPFFLADSLENRRSRAFFLRTV
jgi:hypothetical protein